MKIKMMCYGKLLDGPKLVNEDTDVKTHIYN